MKFTVRHVLNSPTTAPTSLLGRIRQSNSPIQTDLRDERTSGPGNQDPAAGKTNPLPQSKIILEVHPSLPIICYVDLHGNVDNPLGNARKPDGKGRYAPATVSPTQKQRIVIQNFLTNHTLATIGINQIAKTWISKSNKSGEYPDVDIIRQECHRLGIIESLQFLDSYVVRRHSGYPIPPQNNEKENSLNDIGNENNHYSSESTSYLIIQWSTRIIIWPISLSAKVASYSHHHRPMCEISTNDLNNAMPTSKPISVLSTGLLAIGCSDGAVRFYSHRRQKIIKSVRGPNGRGDAVVGIVPMNTWNFSSLNDNNMNHGTDGDYANKGGGHSLRGEGTFRILTVCSSGYAYLWEMIIAYDSTQFGYIVKKIRAPLLKIDGFGDSEKKNMPSSPSRSTNEGGSSTLSSTGYENYDVEYDMDRQLLFWKTKGGYGGSSKAYIAVWDFHESSLPTTQQLQNSNGTPTNGGRGMVVETPLHRPRKIIQCSGTDGLGPETNIISMLHPSFSTSTLLFISGSKKGDLTIMTSSSDINPYELKDVSRDAKAKHVVSEKAAIYHEFRMKTMMKQSNMGKNLGLLDVLNGRSIKLLALSPSLSRPDVILMATNIGLIVVHLEDEDELRTGVFHASIYQKGVSSTNRVIGVHEDSLYITSLDTSSNATTSPKGYLPVKDPLLVYKSPHVLNESFDFQSSVKPVRIPPRILPSPSRKFVCLFWHSESRYEILHTGSIFNAAKGIIGNDAEKYSQTAVDSQNDVKSFAWVDDSDVFAILHPPKVDIPDSASNEENDLVNMKPESRIELKVLVGVNADAMKMSGCSIAAATAKTIIHSLQLRGRHPPTILFGGPILCVGSRSKDGETSQSDGMAHFYSKKEQPNDGYVSIGPSLPYPDIVVWDDDGKICAFIVARQVAIYLSNPPNFTLLGTTYLTAQLGSDLESDITVHSAKFLGRVLFISTQLSIQCIFLGDVENEKRICELDSFVLSSIVTHVANINQPGIEPNPLPIPLLNSSPLMYFQGGLLVSTTIGLCAIPIANPLIKIGILLATGHHDKAQRWFDAVNRIDHETLTSFVERRGWPEIVMQLPGLSLETTVDLCIRNNFSDNLEHIIELHGLETIRQIDTERNTRHSIVVCLGAYFLSIGNSEFVRRLATECMTLNGDGKKDAFELATLLLTIDPSDAKRLIKRALFGRSDDSWLLGDFVKDCFLTRN